MTDVTNRKPILIPINDLPPHESAARLFATLAYPTDAKRRQRFEDAICNKVIRELASDPHWAAAPQAIRPRHLLMSAEYADAEFKRGMRIINNERLIAGKMAAPLWATFVRDQTGLIHPGLAIVGPTSADMISAVSIDLDDRRGAQGDANKGNIIARAWSPSKPVLHLCLGLHKVIHDVAADRRGLALGDFVFDAALTHAVISAAAVVFTAPEVFALTQGDLVEVIAA